MLGEVAGRQLGEGEPVAPAPTSALSMKAGGGWETGPPQGGGHCSQLPTVASPSIYESFSGPTMVLVGRERVTHRTDLALVVMEVTKQQTLPAMASAWQRWAKPTANGHRERPALSSH